MILGVVKTYFCITSTTSTKYGNARYLKNELISNQSVVEIYNLDVLGLALLAIVIMSATTMLLVYKLMKYFYQILGKPKTD